MRKVIALAALTLVAPSTALAHHPPVKTPKDEGRLIVGYTRLYDKAQDTKGVTAGRDVFTQGRPKDGRISWNLIRREYKRLWVALHPGPERIHKQRAEAARRAARWALPAGLSLPPSYIKQCESGGSYTVVNPSSGAGGAWQFLPSTWQSVGGTGLPQHASPREQDFRAAILWNNGAGASHWQCA